MSTTLTKRESAIGSPWFRRGPLATLREEMRDLFSQAFSSDEEFWPFARTVPSLDLCETGQAVEARIDLPGVDPKEVDIQISGNVLTIRGERKSEREEKGATWHRVERRLGGFCRSVILPCAVKEEAVEANYRDGVLTITMPKTEETKARRIEVKT